MVTEKTSKVNQLAKEHRKKLREDLQRITQKSYIEFRIWTKDQAGKIAAEYFQDSPDFRNSGPDPAVAVEFFQDSPDFRNSGPDMAVEFFQDSPSFRNSGPDVAAEQA